MSKLKIFLVGSKEVCNSFSTKLFNDDEYFEIIDSAKNKNEAFDKLKTLNPDLTIVEPEIIEEEINDFISTISSQNKSKLFLFTSKNTFNNLNDNNIIVCSKPLNISIVTKNFGMGKSIVEKIYKHFEIKSKIKVMIVDDSALMRVVISNLLNKDNKIEQSGFASNGQEALELMEKKKPDVILLDIEMPVMDGLQFLRHARLKSNAKIVVLSSIAIQGSTKATEALKLGASAIITKPSGAVSVDLVEKSGDLVLNTIHKVVS